MRKTEDKKELKAIERRECVIHTRKRVERDKGKKGMRKTKERKD